MTLIELIEHHARQLDAAGVAFGHGTTNAFDEAAWLTLWQLGLPLDTPLNGPPHGTAPTDPTQAHPAWSAPTPTPPAHPVPGTAPLAGSAQANMPTAPFDEQNWPVTLEQQALVASLFEKRIATRQPAAYLTQEAWLQGVPFYVDERAIVPRSLIAEVLAEGSIDIWLGKHTRHVLDLCTGNGSLAVLAALAWPDVQVTGADLSADALAVARINVDRHGLAERIALVESDGLAAFLADPAESTHPAQAASRPTASHAPQRFDLILCNPPYVSADSMAALPAEFRAEPSMALSGNTAGGTDGMDFIRPLLAQAPAHMTPDAVLVLEIGHERPFFEAAFPGLAVVWLSTSAGDDQVLLVTREALVELS